MSDEHPDIDDVSTPNKAGSDKPEPEGYDAWLKREIEAGLKEADSPGAVWHTLEESNEKMRQLRARREQSTSSDPANYEEWLQRELTIGLKEADDPDSESFSADEVDDYMRQQKAAYLRRPLERAS